MPRPGQIRRPRGWVNRNLDGVGPVVSRDSRGHSLPRINRFAKCSAVIGSILCAHRTNAQMVQPLFRHGEANQPTAVLGHKVDGLGSNFFGCQSKIAFVLAVFVIHHDNHAAGADFFDSSRDICKRLVSHTESVAKSVHSK